MRIVLNFVDEGKFNEFKLLIYKFIIVRGGMAGAPTLHSMDFMVIQVTSQAVNFGIGGRQLKISLINLMR